MTWAVPCITVMHAFGGHARHVQYLLIVVALSELEALHQ